MGKPARVAEVARSVDGPAITFELPGRRPALGGGIDRAAAGTRGNRSKERGEPPFRGDGLGGLPLEADELAPSELIGLLLGSRGALGTLPGGSLTELARARPRELALRLRLPLERATRLAAAFALGRRVAAEPGRRRVSMRSPARVHRLLEPEVRGLERETFHVLLLDGKHALRRRERVSEGTLTSSLVHPREVFRSAVREAAAAIVCAHNHPSGDPEPSPEDLEVTRRLIRAGKLLGIPLLDHVVIGAGRYVSLRERMDF